MGRSTELGMSVWLIESKVCLYRKNVDDMKIAGGKQTMSPIWKKWMKLVDLGEPTSFLDHVRLGSNVNANQMKQLLNNLRRCLNHVFLREQLRHCLGGRNLSHKQWRGPATWKDMRKNALKDTSGWRKSSCMKSQLLAWATTTSRTKSWKRMDNCPKHAPKSSRNAFHWHELVDLTLLTFITRVITDNIAVWVIRLSIVDWVYSKTQILLETMKIPNQHLLESCVSSEVERLFP